MEENEKVVLDWVHLPTGVQAESIWAALHDARLYFVASDRLARTATLRFEIFYLDEGVTITFVVEAVTSLRAERASRWPGGYTRPEGTSRTAESKLITEYQAKGRMESLNWNELELSLGPANLTASDDDQDCLDVFAAHRVQNGEETALYLQGNLQSSDLWHELFLRGSRLSVSRSDGGDLSLEQLVALGEAWWNRPTEEKTD